jgi:two-component system cell cycle response regulator
MDAAVPGMHNRSMNYQSIDSDDVAHRAILVVDDDPVIRRYLEAQLSRLGCRLIFATNGLEAMEVLEKEHPDLVLLDIVMPGLDGFEVCRRIKGNLETNDIPVVHLTDLKGEAKEQSFASGADDFLNKPPNFVELRSRIRSHLLIKSLLAERQRVEARQRVWQWEKSRPARILVVESQENLRDMMIDELRHLGHDAVGAENLQDCVVKLGTGLPDLLLLDHQLADGSGSAFAAHLRNYARSRDLPVLILCARSALEKEIHSGEAGPIDYLTKPFQPAELRIRVEVLLRHGSLLREREANRFGTGKHLLLDPQTGAFTDAFLEAHLELLLKALAGAERSLALVAAGGGAVPGGWSESKETVDRTAKLLNSTLQAGEAICRVAERSFVLVLPGLDKEKLDARMETLRQVGFGGPLVGMVVPRKASATAILGKLALALQKAKPLSKPTL